MKQMITYQTMIDRRQFNMKSAKTPDREHTARLNENEPTGPKLGDRSASTALCTNLEKSKN